MNRLSLPLFLVAGAWVFSPEVPDWWAPPVGSWYQVYVAWAVVILITAGALYLRRNKQP